MTRFSVSSALALSLAILPLSSAQIATPCVTVTSTTTGPYPVSSVCPEDIVCDPIVTRVTQPCGCPFPATTVTATAARTYCPLCVTDTIVVRPTTCTTASCPIVTETGPPACAVPTNCTVEACVQLSTITIPCSCTGIATVSDCNGGCPIGCETLYTGLRIPCPTTPPS